MPEAVRVKLLGGFRVSVGSRIVGESGWRLSKARSLVKLLALAPDHRLHREQIMEWLWPDLDPKAAANNLRQALHVARRVLDPVAPATSSRYLQLRGDWLALYPDGPLRVDVETFEEAATTARRVREPAAYRAVLGLYAGDLLPEDRYERWAEDRREGLRWSYLTLLIELARLYEERGDFESAIEALGKVVASELTHEEAHVSLMRLYAASGRRHEAILQYERLRDALAGGLGTEPGEAGRRLHEEIWAGRLPAGELPADDRTPVVTPAREAPRHNLPVERTSFVGHEEEIVEVKWALAMIELLTLTGTDGSGKTRFALQMAKDLVEAYPDGVWLVERAGLSEGELVPQAVAQALGVHEQPDRPPTATLVDSLRTKNLLLVLDNCEHLMDTVVRLVETLMNTCPDLRLLATSREALGVAGELVWQVPSLSMPAPGRSPAVEELGGYESVRLFVERARSRDSDFALTPGNAEAVAEICRRLDGIPLAIELAAVRAGALSAEQIAQGLKDSLEPPTGGDRAAPSKQRTLRGTLDWSYELLSEEERKLFSRLSVFAGGWTLEAAEAVFAGGWTQETAEVVGAGGGIEAGDVLDLLSRLVGKSLVEAEAGEGDALRRYRMLEPVRRYGRERLEKSGEADAVRRRHASWFLALAEEAEPELKGARQEAWLEWLETEHGNLRAALGWVLERETELALRLAGALGEFWHMRGYLSEGRWWLEAALAKGDDAPPASARVRALAHAGYIAWEQGDYERSIALGEESLALAREAKDDFAIVLSLGVGALAALGRGDHRRTMTLLKESLELSRRLQTMHPTAFHLSMAAALASSEGRPVRSARLWGAAESLREATGTVLLPVERRLYGLYSDAARAGLDEEAWEAAWAEGKAMTPEEAVEYVLPEEEPAPRSASPAPERPPAGEPATGFTRREEEVAVLVERGLSNRQIAEELGISEHTAIAHVRNILKKLGLHSRAQITAWVIERRLLPEDPG